MSNDWVKETLKRPRVSPWIVIGVDPASAPARAIQRRIDSRGLHTSRRQGKTLHTTAMQEQAKRLFGPAVIIDLRLDVKFPTTSFASSPPVMHICKKEMGTRHAATHMRIYFLAAIITAVTCIAATAIYY